jgi:hypothetical protein
MLIVNADVTVVLVGSDKAYVHADGDGAFINDLEIKQSGDTIMINSKRRKDLKARGIVFIPASQLKRIKINSGAHVRSLNTLQIPKLDVVINGACILAVSNIGALNLIETDDYSFEQTSEVRYWPSKVFLNN